MKKVTVSADALAAVLHALNGPPHYIRELQVIQSLPFNDDNNPIAILVKEYNEAVELHNSQIEKRAAKATFPCGSLGEEVPE